jgi:hypothetical protein
MDTTSSLVPNERVVVVNIGVAMQTPACSTCPSHATVPVPVPVPVPLPIFGPVAVAVAVAVAVTVTVANLGQRLSCDHP